MMISLNQSENDSKEHRTVYLLFEYFVEYLIKSNGYEIYY